jgi:CubicO group peptidase (beta-lactamase class C family)
MKNMLLSGGKSTVLFLLVISATFIQCKNKSLELPPAQNFSQDRISTLQSFVNQMMENYPIPGLAIGIIHQDSVYYTSAGIKNSKNERLTTSTPILGGSISEPVLADAVLKLANSGAINLDDKVVKYLSYFTMGGHSYEKITIRHLLTHTSGIDHYNIMWDLPNFSPDAPEITTRSIATQQPKWDQPGTHVLRSPYNYDILADLVSKVTNRPFEDYVRDEIFSPSGMKNTRFYKVKNTAMPFGISDWLKYTYKQNNAYPYNRENGGSGGLHTSAEDISTWMYQVLHQSSTTTAQNYSQFFQSQFSTGNKSAIGLGLDIRNNGSSDVFSKGSQYGGFSQQMIMIPSKNIGVAVLSNISGDFNPSTIANDIANWLSGKEKLAIKIPISLVMAKELSRTGKIENAFKLYRDFKTAKPDKYDFSVQALELFGTNLLHRVNDKKNAIKAFEFCVNQYPASSSANLHLAEAYVLNKEVNNTKEAIKRALALKDDTGTRESFLIYLNEKIEIIEEKQRS